MGSVSGTRAPGPRAEHHSMSTAPPISAAWHFRTTVRSSRPALTTGPCVSTTSIASTCPGRRWAVNEPPAPGAEGIENLDLISTHWSALRDSNRFLIRYAQAVRSYLLALLGNADDADDVAHDFFVRVIERGFEHADPQRGRFRDYLKIAVRNAGLSHLRRKQGQPRTVDALPSTVPDPEGAADRAWLREWQACVLERAWRALERHQRASPDNRSHTVLRMQTDHPEDDSRALADRVAVASGRPLSAEAYRKGNRPAVFTVGGRAG